MEHPSPPNIILVVFDTARRDRFGCYGYGRPTTPTVDGLARGGLVVETMISNGPWTMPAHGALFSGLYPSQHGCTTKGRRLRPTVATTVAEWLGCRGYDTWCATNNGLIGPRSGLARGFGHYHFPPDTFPLWRRAVRRVGAVAGRGHTGGAVVNDWLRRALPPARRRPLFLFVNYLECHWPYMPLRRFERRVSAAGVSPLAHLRYRLLMTSRFGPYEAIARATARELRLLSDLYDAALAQADHHLANVLGILERAGYLSRPTVVIVTADHGEHLGEHGLAGHAAALDDTLIRVPFVVWGPGIISPGRVADGFEFVDVLPSLAALLGAPLPAPYLGGRRRHLFSGADQDGDDVAFAEYLAWPPGKVAQLIRRNPSYDFAGLARDLVCARTRRFKLILRGDGTQALYDLETDPGETTDVSARHPAAVTALQARVAAARAEWAPWGADTPALSREEEREIDRRLADLGYI
jgi:arylsulfatase A-like enzyme